VSKITLWAMVLALVVLIVTACGPADEADGDNSELVAETIRIAQEYVETGDINRARVQLQVLDVANPNQWLVYLAEASVVTDASAEATRALAQLTIALGLQSRPVQDFAASNKLLPQTAPAVAAAPTAPSGATQLRTANVEPQAAEESEAAEATAPEASVPEAVVLLPTPTARSEAQISATVTAEPLILQPTPTETTISKPVAKASNGMNVRGGPGTAYPVVGALDASAEAEIIAKNPSGDWWQVVLPGGQQGWVYGPLVAASGDTAAIAIAANIPQPPPTPTPAPVAEAPTATPVPAAPAAPAAPAPAEPAAPAPAADGPDFVVVEKRLWDVYENGGSLSGPTVICGEKRQLVVNVVDANGSRINGVAVQAQYGAKEIFVTGAQGKGDGVVEFVLGRGQDVRVIRDSDGREVTSEMATGLSTEPAAISYENLKAGKFCTDDVSCKLFVDAPGCWGHYSWTVTFKRKY
jgi:uncharacterized protein YraI